MIKKKQMFKIIIALSLSLLVLAGCKAKPLGNGKSDVKKGVFVQSIINPDVGKELGFSGLEQLTNGAILLTSFDEFIYPHVFVGDGTGDWQETKNEVAGQLIQKIFTNGHIAVFTITEDETWWIAEGDFGLNFDEEAVKEESSAKIYKVKGDNVQEIEIDILNEINSSNEVYLMEKIISGENNNIHILISETSQRTKAYWVTFNGDTGKEISRILTNPREKAIQNSTIKNTTVYIPDNSGGQITAYSLETGK